jgi:hypothetical protein
VKSNPAGEQDLSILEQHRCVGRSWCQEIADRLSVFAIRIDELNSRQNML